ncbi:MAG TPA: NTP transferase domain-containing protein [Syntrophales bacterium]|nr:NTP transferase domain-containing protein [Syntrophales bacterium]HOD98390.1 NTP transferase domain-containing protein [Syntrophales bacterium]HOH73058.1 NTP transferase domain-containing protein [Syntrophales bacterium]HPN08296.1 NTP transferase domain-containing protein [Syntrophales bacterium]HPX81000.1 NTP transferase domain-containing protein [Syntrophales bacterium]
MTIEPRTFTDIHHALIIAAGRGRRFHADTEHRPKPLLEIDGQPLIMHVIGRAARAGIDSFTVITGYRGEDIEAYLTRETPAGICIRCIRNTEWERPNGISVLAARGAVPDAFALMMADHLFDPRLLGKLFSTPLIEGHCRLAVDFHPPGVPDLEDATKVKANDGQVLDIGKEIPYYNGIDTGVFLCTEGIFPALETAVSRERESLSEGVRELARRGRMEAMDVTGLFWLDIDDETGLFTAKAALRGISPLHAQLARGQTDDSMGR